MILLNRHVSHGFVHNPKWASIEAKWGIKIEESDIPDFDTRDRFDFVDVTQIKTLSTGKIKTYFKGSRTITFDKSTRDKQKKMVINMIDGFLLDNNHPVIHHYESAEPNN